jgi:tetratricopeptide (TPR) repeat protein
MLDPQDLIRSEGIQHWLADNLKTVVTVAGVLVLVGAAWGIVEFVRNRAEDQAAGLYATAMDTYQGALTPDRQLRVLSPEAKDALDRAAGEFRKIRDEYPRTQHAALALFHQANAYAALERYDDAISAYETWLTTYSQRDLAPLVIQRLAYTLWAKGALEDAVRRFDEVIAIPDAMNRDLAHFEKARAFEQMGQKDKALEAYTTLSKEFSSSPWSSEGNARIVALGGTPPGREANQQEALPPGLQPQPPAPQGQAPPPESPAPPAPPK